MVIDPGHGGTNVGAPGAVHGLYEKRVTMKVSRLVAEKLRRLGVEVVLTRTDDRYLTLRQRVRMANQLNATFLVSIHANATPNHDRRGFETFILTPEALDVDGRALRLGDGAPRLGLDDETSRVLDDIERGVALPDAAGLALSIQDKLREVRGEENDRGIRQDSMHVLLGATMPAVLVEVGFIDHPIEGPELVDPAVQDQIAGALAAAIAERVASR